METLAVLVKFTKHVRESVGTSGEVLSHNKLVAVPLKDHGVSLKAFFEDLDIIQQLADEFLRQLRVVMTDRSSPRYFSAVISKSAQYLKMSVC